VKGTVSAAYARGKGQNVAASSLEVRFIPLAIGCRPADPFSKNVVFQPESLTLANGGFPSTKARTPTHMEFFSIFSSLPMELTDGVVFLRPPCPEDAADHLAGEDPEIAKWFSGGRSTMATVQSYIKSCEDNWRDGWPRRAFGIFDCATNRLIGGIEANLAFPFLSQRRRMSPMQYFRRGEGAEHWPTSYRSPGADCRFRTIYLFMP
jgi:hypothetical protein